MGLSDDPSPAPLDSDPICRPRDDCSSGHHYRKGPWRTHPGAFEARLGAALGGRSLRLWRGALLTEFAAVAGVGAMFGIACTLTPPVAAAFLIGIAMAGSCRRVERIGVALVLAELVFIPAVIMARPGLYAITEGWGGAQLGNGS